MSLKHYVNLILDEESYERFEAIKRHYQISKYSVTFRRMLRDQIKLISQEGDTEEELEPLVQIEKILRRDLCVDAKAASAILTIIERMRTK